MAKFDQQQLLDAFYRRDLVPAWIEEIKALPDSPALAQEVLTSPALKVLEGEWRTDDDAKRRFWLTLHAGSIRLQTSKPGFWISTKTSILEISEHRIKCGAGRKPIEVMYKKQNETLTIDVPGPGVYQGKFKLTRAAQEGD